MTAFGYVIFTFSRGGSSLVPKLCYTHLTFAGSKNSMVAVVVCDITDFQIKTATLTSFVWFSFAFPASAGRPYMLCDDDDGGLHFCFFGSVLSQRSIAPTAPLMALGMRLIAELRTTESPNTTPSSVAMASATARNAALVLCFYLSHNKLLVPAAL